MVWLHRKPAAIRGGARRYPELGAMRMLIQVFVLLFAGDLLFIPPFRVTDIFLAASQFVYLVFFYMTDISSQGQSGRRRKLALAELKKLFGTAWMPKPALVPE